jgi:hypothetical protein
MVSMVVASSLYYSPSSLLLPRTLFDSHKLFSSNQTYGFLHHHYRFNSKRVLPSVCFFNARDDKSDTKLQAKVLSFFKTLFFCCLLSIFVDALEFA